MRRLTVLLILVVIACQPRTTELTDERKAEIAAEVNARNAEYWDAWRAADWDRGMAYYVDSPDFVWAAGGVVFYGKERLKQSRPAFASVASQAFLFRDSRTVVMAPEAARVIALGTWLQVDSGRHRSRQGVRLDGPLGAAGRRVEDAHGAHVVPRAGRRHVTGARQRIPRPSATVT